MKNMITREFQNIQLTDEWERVAKIPINEKHVYSLGSMYKQSNMKFSSYRREVPEWQKQVVHQ